MNERATFNNVTCPFCGLACDDLEVSCNGYNLTTSKTLPKPCRSHFENSAAQSVSAQPKIHGKNATLDDAVAEAARLIQEANRPLLGGLLLDVKGAQESIRLARACGGIVDHSDGDAASRNIKVLQNTGWVLATLSEVRTRADFIVVVGDQLLERYPRLVERVLTGQRPFRENANPEFALIGPWRECIPDPLRDGLFEVVNVAVEEIPNCVQMMVAATNDYAVEGEIGEAILRIVSKIKNASYTALLWDASDLKYPQADLMIETLANLSKLFNRETRCAGVPLGGNSTTLNNVCLWQTGLPIRTDFGAKPPVYDPHCHAMSRLLTDKAVDLLIWMAVLRDDSPPEHDLPMIAITRPDTVLPESVEVHIPVGIPGIDHIGHIFRSDSVVMVPLKQLRKTGLPSAAEVIAGIRRQLSKNGVMQC